MKSYLLKIRGGVEVDSQGKKAGKGPLVAEEISNTLGTHQDQYLFQPQVINLNKDDVQSKQILDPKGIAPSNYAGESRGGGGEMYVIENHPQDSRVKIKDDGIVQTLDARMGMGGGNVPLVMFSKVRRAQSKDDYETWKQSVCTNTLNTFDQGDVRATDVVLCMATQQGGAEIMENRCPTITASAGMSGNNQPVIVLESNGQRPSHQAVCYWDGGQTVGTLTANNAGGSEDARQESLPMHHRASR